MSISKMARQNAGRSVAFAVAGVLCGSSVVQADTISWNGLSSALWSDAANWNGGVLPTSADDLVFGSTTGNRTMTNDLLSSVNSMQNNGAAYVLNGNALTTATHTGTAAGSGNGFAYNVALNLPAGGLTFNNSGATRVESNADIAGTGGVIKTGTGPVRWTTAKSFSGGLAINAGTLELVTANDSIPNGVGKGNVTIAAGAFLFNNNTSFVINGLNGAGSITRGGTNSRTITIGNNDANGTFTGSITHSGGSSGLNKIGTGTQTLGAVTLPGTLTVTAGKLDLNGLASVGVGSVVAGGTLGGTGTLSTLAANTTTVNGTIAPGTAGAQIESLDVANGSLTLAGTAEYQVDLTTNLNDSTAVGSTLTYGGVLNVLFTGNNAGGAYDLFDFATVAGAFSSVNFTGLTAGQTASFDPTTGIVNVTAAVPEPTTIAALAGVGVLALRRRRSAR